MPAQSSTAAPLSAPRAAPAGRERAGSGALAKKAVATALVAGLLAIVAVLRLPLPHPPNDVDSAWKVTLAALWQEGSLSGRDFSFTYGPLAQAIAAFGVRLHAADDALASAVLIDLAFCWVNLLLCWLLICLLPGLDWQRAVAVLALIGLVQVPFHYASFRPLAVMVAGAVAALATLPTRRRWAALAAAAAGCASFLCQLLSAELGLYALAATVGVFAAWAARDAVVGARDRSRRGLSLLRRHGGLALSAVAAFAAANLALLLVFALTKPAHPTPLWTYVRGVFDQISGYPAAMGMAWALERPFTLALALVALWTWAWLAWRLRTDGSQSARVLLACGIVSIITLKGATVRADIGHIFLGITPLLVLFFCSAAYASRGSGRLWPWLSTSWLLVAGWPLLDEEVLRQSYFLVTKHVDARPVFAHKRNYRVPPAERVPAELEAAIGGARPIAAIPYSCQLAVALNRPLAAPVLQAYAAYTLPQQRRFVARLEQDYGEIDVILGLDGEQPVALDHVQTISRLPVIFEHVVEHYQPRERSLNPSPSYLLLEPRDVAGELLRTPIAMAPVPGSASGQVLTATHEVSCSLVAVKLALRYPFPAALTRPAALNARFSHRGREILATRLLPLASGEMETFVNLAPATSLPGLFWEGLPGVEWDSVRVWPEDNTLSVAPTILRVEELSCLELVRSEAPHP